jgi:hypothetical protein
MKGARENNPIQDASGLWFMALKDYIEDNEAKLCPACQQIQKYTNTYNQYTSWGPCGESQPDWASGSDHWIVDPNAQGEVGSYGFNNWLYNPPAEWGDWNQGNTELNWRTADVRQAADIPVLLDSKWYGGKPEVDDPAPDDPSLFYPGGRKQKGYMRIFCMDRHGAGTNALFLDMTVRKIGLKEDLWHARWHKNYPVDYPLPPGGSEWPEWLRKLQ